MQHCIVEWIKQDSSKGQCPMCRQSKIVQKFRGINAKDINCLCRVRMDRQYNGTRASSILIIQQTDVCIRAHRTFENKNFLIYGVRRGNSKTWAGVGRYLIPPEYLQNAWVFGHSSWQSLTLEVNTHKWYIDYTWMITFYGVAMFCFSQSITWLPIPSLYNYDYNYLQLHCGFIATPSFFKMILSNYHHTAQA